MTKAAFGKVMACSISKEVFLSDSLSTMELNIVERYTFTHSPHRPSSIVGNALVVVTSHGHHGIEMARSIPYLSLALPLNFASPPTTGPGRTCALVVYL